MSVKPRLPWPDRFEERLHIFALGETFDVDAFLATSSLKPSYVWWRIEGGLETSGLELFLGEGRSIPLRTQEEIAMSYLKKHRDELRSLMQYPGLEAINLGLVYICRPTTVGFCVGPSRALMRSALDVGVTPTYYVTIEGRGSSLNDE